MRKNILTLGVAVWSLVAVATLAGLAAMPVAAQDGLPEWLITMSASKGAVLHEGDSKGCYTLTLEGGNSVVFFTDRPNREAHSAHAYTLIDGWEEAALEQCPEDTPRIRSGAERRRATASTGSGLEVGHVDLLALPPEPGTP